MHRKNLNNKNKVYNINTKSYINNWNKLALYFRISHTKSILNVYVLKLKSCYVKRFSKLSYMFFLNIFASFTPGKQPYFEISEMTTHTPCARDIWWTLDFATAFLSPGVNSRAELVPSPRAYAQNGAARRWLGNKYLEVNRNWYPMGNQYPMVLMPTEWSEVLSHKITACPIKKSNLWKF
jgi:hypothetical protein